MRLDKGILENLKQAIYNTHLVIPLKYEQEKISFDKINKIIGCSTVFNDTYCVKGSDLRDGVNDLFKKDNAGHIACVYTLSKDDFLECCFGNKKCELRVDFRDKTDLKFDVEKVFLYVFRNSVAFLCISFEFASTQVMRCIYDPTCKNTVPPSDCIYRINGKENKRSFNDIINKLLENSGLTLFYSDNGKFLFYNAYSVSLAVIPERIGDIDILKQATYNLQRITELYCNESDDKELSLTAFTYPHSKNGTYQWCASVDGNAVSRVRCADEGKSLKEAYLSQLDDFRGNSLTLVILALYQKYAGLLFLERIVDSIRRKRGRFAKLELEIIDFKAFGVVPISGVSVDKVVRDFYRQLLEVNELEETLENIDKKLNVIAEHTKEVVESKINVIMAIVSIFGIVSILADTLGVLQAIRSGERLELLTVVVTVLGIALSAGICILLFGKKQK